MATDKVDVLSIIKKLDSGTIKALLVATIPLLALIGSLFGIDEAVFNAKASQVTEIILALVTAAGIAWAAWSRLFNPTPPLTETAKEKTIEAIAANKLQTTSHALDGQGGYAKLSLLISVLCASVLAGCAATQAIQHAETLEQRAAALIGDFGIFQSAAKTIGSDATVAIEVRTRVLDAAIAAKPAVDRLDELLRSYRLIEHDLAAGSTTSEKLAIASQQLSAWITEVAPKIASLRTTVEGVRP